MYDLLHTLFHSYVYLIYVPGVTLDIQRKKHILFYNLLLLKFSKIIIIFF